LPSLESLPLFSNKLPREKIDKYKASNIKQIKSKESKIFRNPKPGLDYQENHAYQIRKEQSFLAITKKR